MIHITLFVRTFTAETQISINVEKSSRTSTNTCTKNETGQNHYSQNNEILKHSLKQKLYDEITEMATNFLTLNNFVQYVTNTIVDIWILDRLSAF